MNPPRDRQLSQLRRYLRDAVLPFSKYYGRLFAREPGLRLGDVDPVAPLLAAGLDLGRATLEDDVEVRVDLAVVRAEQDVDLRGGRQGDVDVAVQGREGHRRAR